MTNTKFLLKKKSISNYKDQANLAQNRDRAMIQWFLLLDDDIKQHIIDVYNDKDLGLTFWEYLGVAYNNWIHPIER